MCITFVKYVSEFSVIEGKVYVFLLMFHLYKGDTVSLCIVTTLFPVFLILQN